MDQTSIADRRLADAFLDWIVVAVGVMMGAWPHLMLSVVALGHDDALATSTMLASLSANSLLLADPVPPPRRIGELPAFASTGIHGFSPQAHNVLARAFKAASSCPCPGRCAQCESVHDAIRRVEQGPNGNRSCFLHYRAWWRAHALATAVAAAAHGLNDGLWHAYEFGVYRGRSMRYLDIALHPRRWWAFDSFQGLPSSREPWAAGTLVDDQRESLSALLGAERVSFVAGWYNESLPPAPAVLAQMRPALWVDIDCDLYLSTAQALDFMFAHALIRPGTLIGYDDWWSEPCRGVGSPLGSGEGRAHVEMANKYRVRFECVAGPCAKPSQGHYPRPGDHSSFSPMAKRAALNPRYPLQHCSVHLTWGPIFLVRAMGPGVEPDHGFTWTEALANYSLVCFIPNPRKRPLRRSAPPV